MGLDSHLIHTATVQRATQTADPYGNGRLSWYDVAVTPCRLVEKAERIWTDERAEWAVHTVYLLLVPAGCEVAERDRVEVDSVTYSVTACLNRSSRFVHHKSLALERVS